MDKLEYKISFRGKVPQVHRCDVCRSYFSKSIFSIYNHARRRHCFKSEPFDCEESSLEHYYCGICQFEFDTILLLKKHIIDQHSPEDREENSPPVYEIRSYICRNCSFQTYSYLHWFKHASDECNVDECEPCPSETIRKCDLKRYSSAHRTDDKDKKWFKCEQCVYKTVGKSNLKRHSTACHTHNKDKKWFGCEQCGFKTLHKSDLKRHFITHVDDKDRQWLKCEQCAYKTFRKGDLKRHFSAHHTGDKDKKWFKCEQCTFKTLQSGNLKRHFTARHTDDVDKQWFKCEQCTYKTLLKSDLKRHLKMRHVDDKNKE